MKRSFALLLLTAAFSVPASAQRINIDLPEFRGLRDKAAEEVTVTLDASMLRLASRSSSPTKTRISVRARHRAEARRHLRAQLRVRSRR